MQTSRSQRTTIKQEESNARLPSSSEGALKFQDRESLAAALTLLEELSDGVPLEYDPISDKGTFAVVIPMRFFGRVISFLEEHDIECEEMQVIPISELPPERQARIRGLIR